MYALYAFQVWRRGFSAAKFRMNKTFPRLAVLFAPCLYAECFCLCFCFLVENDVLSVCAVVQYCCCRGVKEVQEVTYQGQTQRISSKQQCRQCLQR